MKIWLFQEPCYKSIFVKCQCYFCYIFTFKTIIWYSSCTRNKSPGSSHPSGSTAASFKGIVHPKMKIVSSFTHPQVVPNLYECLCSAEHKGRYSEECGKQSSHGATLTSCFSYYGSQWCPKTAWLQTFFRISSFVFSRANTFIQVWNYLRVSKWWHNFHFWVNYPFKSEYDSVGYITLLIIRKLLFF